MGALGNECGTWVEWEYVLHRLPSLSKLHIVFVGLELLEEMELDQFKLCPECKRNKRKLSIEIKIMEYKDYMENRVYTVPDMVLAFNPGFGTYGGSHLGQDDS